MENLLHFTIACYFRTWFSSKKRHSRQQRPHQFYHYQHHPTSPPPHTPARAAHAPTRHGPCSPRKHLAHPLPLVHPRPAPGFEPQEVCNSSFLRPIWKWCGWRGTILACTSAPFVRRPNANKGSKPPLPAPFRVGVEGALLLHLPGLEPGRWPCGVHQGCDWWWGVVAMHDAGGGGRGGDGRTAGGTECGPPPPPSKWWLGPIASRGSPPDTYRPARRFCGRG